MMRNISRLFFVDKLLPQRRIPLFCIGKDSPFARKAHQMPERRISDEIPNHYGRAKKEQKRILPVTKCKKASQRE